MAYKGKNPFDKTKELHARASVMNVEKRIDNTVHFRDPKVVIYSQDKDYDAIKIDRLKIIERAYNDWQMKRMERDSLPVVAENEKGYDKYIAQIASYQKEVDSLNQQWLNAQTIPEPQREVFQEIPVCIVCTETDELMKLYKNNPYKVIYHKVKDVLISNWGLTSDEN